MWRAAMRLSMRHRKTVLSLRTAAIRRGGLKEDCETQVMVAAPRVLPLREVRTYIPLVSRRKVFCLVFWSTSHRGRRGALYVNAERYAKGHTGPKVRLKPSGCMLKSAGEDKMEISRRLTKCSTRRYWLVIAAGVAMFTFAGLAQQAPTAGPYKIVKTAKVGGDGGFDYVYADDAGRRLYIPRTGPSGRITVFDLDTLAPVGTLPNANARGVAVDPKSNHGFASSKPMVMWDTKTLATIKTIDVQGGPDGILFDAYNERVYVFSHGAPNATVINAADGSVVGTIDLGGAPEQAVTDGKGHLYVDIEDKDSIAVVDAKTLAVTAHYDLAGKCGGPGGLAFDVQNHVLFAACHEPKTMG